MRRNPSKHPLVAMPTGSGKTVVLADIISKTIERWPETKILVLSHVKEILTQDYKSLKFHTGLDIGLNSAGLGRRERKQITVAGIQSVHKRCYDFKEYQLIIIDECHLIPPQDTSMYRGFFAGLNNPRYFGLTATPFRLKGGYIYGQKDSIFDDLIYDLTEFDNFNKLIEDGYLCNLKSQLTQSEFDLTGVHIRGGDFDKHEMSNKFDKESITKTACKEIVSFGQSYKKWLIFAIDTKHADSIAENLIKLGVPTLVVHSKMEMNRDRVIQTYKEGHIRALVNVNVLTTGFDDPEIDLIALLRPTQSPVIHVQTIGRGLRSSPNKSHCLILDFAGNTERIGPINDVRIVKSRRSKKDKEGGGLTKRCPDCDTIHHIKAEKCIFCGYKFPIKTRLQSKSSNADVIATKKTKWFDVNKIQYAIHHKPNSPDSLKVTYECGPRIFREWICLDHRGFAGHKAKHWANFRGVDARTVEDLFDKRHNLKQPKRIKIDTRGKYPDVTDFDFPS